MSRASLCIAGLLILLAPFGEGGRAAWSLLLLHTLTIVFCLAIARGATTPSGWRLPEASGARLLMLAVLLAAAAAMVAAAGAGYPYAAGLGLIDRAVIAALLIASLGLQSSAADAAILRGLVVASTALQAGLALLRGFGGGAADAGELFLNPNHLGAYLNIGLLCCVAALTSAPWRARAAAGWGGLSLLHLVAILRLESRGALLGLLGGGLLLLAARWRGWSPRARRIAAETLLLVTLVGGATVALRFMRADDPFRYHRLSIWRASAGMIAEQPLFGYGPGMFRHVSPAHNFPLEEGPVRYGRRFHGAHSTLLTLAAEDGLPAALLVLAATLVAIGLLLRQRERGERDGNVALGVAAALGALLVQGTVEDLLERPAFGIVMALLVGGTVRSTRTTGSLSTPRAAVSIGPSGAGGRGAVRAAAATIALVTWTAAVLLPYLAYRDAVAARAGGRGGLARMERAARLNRYQPEYQHDLAMAAINQGRPDAPAYARAMEHLATAARLKPIDSRFPLMLARLEARLGGTLFDDPQAGERAARLYAAAVRLAPLDPRPRLEQAGHLAELGRLQEALDALRAALELEPHFRRARLLQVSLLARLDRPEAAGNAWAALRSTDAVLAEYIPDSSYAADLTRDAPQERDRLLAVLAGGAESG